MGHGARTTRRRARSRHRVAGGSDLEPAADRLHDELLGPLELLLARGQDSEDPAGQKLLDGPVEAHRGELGGDVRLERAVVARLVHDLGDQVVGLADLAEVVAREGVRRARDLHDDHLHQVRLVAVRVDDERGDLVELLTGDPLLAGDLDDGVKHDLPALGEERVEDLLLRVEVVVDEAVGHARLVGDIGDAAVVEAAPGEHSDRRVEYQAPLVDAAGAGRGHHYVVTSWGQRYAAGTRLARLGRRSRTSAWRSKSRSAATKSSPSPGARASTSPHGSTIMLLP